MSDRIANTFMLRAVQDWGQSTQERAEATAAYLKAAGFDVEPSGYPIFGGMFPQQPIKGKDGEAAHAWLAGVLKNLKRGEYNSEIEQLNAAIEQRAAA
jgi:hypothetical protein